jgi:hypothetical protein
LKAGSTVIAASKAARAPNAGAVSAGPPLRKGPLSIDTLLSGGFEFAGQWTLTVGGSLILDRPAPRGVGVYAFAVTGKIMYVGGATVGLAKRLYFYRTPGPSQKTNQRLNSIIRDELLAGRSVEIYTAAPADREWNGLPIHMSAGLELGLIKNYDLPWNIRSAD